MSDTSQCILKQILNACYHEDIATEFAFSVCRAYAGSPGIGKGAHCLYPLGP